MLLVSACCQPRALAFTGVAIAMIAELSTLSILVHDAAILLPIARFTGIAWLIAAGALLPRTRPKRSPVTTLNAPDTARA